MNDTSPSISIDDSHPLTEEKLDKLLATLYQWGIEDVLFQDGEEIAVKRFGVLIPVGSRPLDINTVSDLLNVMRNNQAAAASLQQGKDDNFTYTLKFDRRTTYRFRVNATQALGKNSSPIGIDITMRSIAQVPPELDKLDIQDNLRKKLFPRNGIVIVGGETGSGKTTLLGAILREMLTSTPGIRAVCYESPIEFDLRQIPNRTGRIAQSNVYFDLADYAHAASNALRRNPDVIVLGEARDYETIRGAIANADTDHLVYATVHVKDVATMITRMINQFPAEEKMQAYTGLISSTKLMIYQKLLPKKGGGRVAIREWLYITESIRTKLYQTNPDDLPMVMKSLIKEFGLPLIKDVERVYESGQIEDELYNKYKFELAA